MSYIGDFNTSAVIYSRFTTVTTTGAPTQLAGSPVLSVYKTNSTTQTTTGVSLGVDHDSVTGLNLITINTSADGTFYAAGCDFQVIITTGTVGGTSVVGYVVAEFSIENRNIKADVRQFGGSNGTFSSGRPEVNTTHAAGTAWGSGAITSGVFAAGAINAAAVADGAIDRATFAADTGLQSIRSNTAQAGASGTITLDASASSTDSLYKFSVVYLTGGTGVGQYRLITAYVGSTKVASVTPAWTTTPDNTSTFAILPQGSVNLQAILAVASAGGSGYVGIDWGAVTNQSGNVLLSNTTVATVATTSLIGSGGIAAASIAADAITAAKIADGAIDAATFASGAINAAAIASDAITAAKIADGAIDAATFASGAINAAAIAADAITAAKIADGAIDNATLASDVRVKLASSQPDYAPLQPTTAGRTLDVSATGEAGLDWANIGSPTTTVSLSGTTISTSQAVASVAGAVGSVTGNVGGNVAGSVGSVTGNVGGNVTGSIGSLGAQAKLDVNAEADTALSDYGALKPTTAGRTLDVTATGAAGIDWGNVENPTTTLDLSSTTISTLQAVASVSGSVGSVTGAVGSVTGNVGGNVAGSVGSVTARVTANTDQLGGSAQSATDLKDFADTGYDPATHKVQGVVLTDTVTTYTGNTPQTGDAYSRLGAPAGASVSADVAAVKSQTASIETDTQDIQTKVGTPAGVSLSADVAAVKSDTAATLTDTNELQTDWTNGGRLDLLIDATKAVTDKLDTALVVDGLVYQFTSNALENAPTGGSVDENAIADAVLSRSVSNVEDTADPHSLCTIILGSLESSRSGANWTIRKISGSTYLVKTLTVDSAADPVTGVT